MTTGAVIFFQGQDVEGDEEGQRRKRARETLAIFQIFSLHFEVRMIPFLPPTLFPLSLSLFLPLSSLSHSLLISPAFSQFLHFVPLRSPLSILLLYLCLTQVLRTADTTWRHSTPNHLPTAPLFNLTPTSHQSEPLLYLLLRYRSALSPGTQCNMRLATRETYTRSRRGENRRIPCDYLLLLLPSVRDTLVDYR